MHPADRPQTVTLIEPALSDGEAYRWNRAVVPQRNRSCMALGASGGYNGNWLQGKVAGALDSVWASALFNSAVRARS